MNSHQLFDNAEQFYNNKKYFRAHIMYMAAIKQCPPEDNVFLSQIYTKLSSTQFAMEKVDESIQSATKAIQTDNSNSRSYFQRGYIYETSQNWRDALHDYQSALKLEPTNATYQDKVKTVEAKIEEHKRNSMQNTVEGENEPIPRFTEYYAKDMIHDMSVNGVRPSRKIATEIVKNAFDIISNLPNVVQVDKLKKITVVGDVHGQFHDVVEIFNKNGFPSDENPYLFNGDFVDRGKEGIEILLALFAFKIAAPNSVFLNRGNHEAEGINRLYGFTEECHQKYGPALYKQVESVFDALPLAHIINHSIFVVHGGLCHDQTITLADIQKINRFREPLATGPVHDLLWSDPMDGDGFQASERCDDGQTNFFGSDVTAKFLQENNLKLLIRSHQVQEEGFSITQNGKCMTIFSAPNYIGQIGNKGAIVKLFFEDDGELKDSEIVTFDSVQKWDDENVEPKTDQSVSNEDKNEECENKNDAHDKE